MLLAACQTSRPTLEAEVAALTAAARSYHEYATALNFDAIKPLYASNARVMAPDTETVQGTEAIGKFVDGLKQVKDLKLSFQNDLEVTVNSGGDSGYTIATATQSFTAEDGSTITETIRDIHLWKLQSDGSWKIVLDVWNENWVKP